MRPIRSLCIYFALVFLGGALLAPWLYLWTKDLAASWPALAKVASNPFHRFLDRALLGMAVIGLWPLLRSCGMARRNDVGFDVHRRWMAKMTSGFALGFVSLACVALLSICFGGRIFNPPQSAGQLAGEILGAIATAIIVSVLEEFLFRGALFGILRKAISWRAALVISSAIYALMHFLRKTDSAQPVNALSGLELLPKMFHAGPGFVPAFLALFIAGAILALAYQRTGALYFSIGLHAGWIFWLKSYALLTVPSPTANQAFWGTDVLVDGWLAAPILLVVLWIVSRMETRAEK